MLAVGKQHRGQSRSQKAQCRLHNSQPRTREKVQIPDCLVRQTALRKQARTTFFLWFDTLNSHEVHLRAEPGSFATRPFRALEAQPRTASAPGGDAKGTTDTDHSGTFDARAITPCQTGLRSSLEPISTRSSTWRCTRNCSQACRFEVMTCRSVKVEPDRKRWKSKRMGDAR